LSETAAGLDLGPNLPDFAAGVLHDPMLAENIRQTHGRLSDEDCGTLEKQSRMTRLLTCWIRSHAEERGTLPRLGPEPRAVCRAKEFLAARFHADPSLADLAQAAHLSPFHLLRVFTRTTGQTPHEFLTQQRVNAAKNLLTSDLSLARIAAECGFADQSHMTRLFRRQHGITPGRYRKILLNQHDESL
jgi:AraC-like DNA-binding protein